MQLSGRTLTLETGRMAKQASGSILLTYGETVLLATATANKDEGEDQYRKVQVLVIYNDNECERKCVDFWGRPQTTEARCKMNVRDLAACGLPF